ncbi:DUF58 domain-containing protein [Psychrobacter sp. I-STPA6b]|uniref:DUF58 domain-containing protein n=1 Tax=Psychrobacter sp. I-STPA6b TaxID=2585718 RepID=UPI001D0C56FC|nr:DUF58 domain-containing protein [Psychrobacter sp. I-STPA6b]
MPLFSPITRPFASRLQRFFANRAPHSDHTTLTLRNVYIFFSREGMLFALLLLITFIMGVNYGNNLVLGLFFYLISIWVISLHVTFAHVSGLQVKLRDIQMAGVGEPIWVTLEVINDKSKPARQIQLEFDKKQTMSVEEGASKQVLATVEGTTLVRLAVASNQRGRFELPRLVVSTVYPLGIMRAWSYVYLASPAWVYPRSLPFEWTEATRALSDDESDWSAYGIKGQNDFDTLDEYVAGESLARVSWAHVARGQGMLTKQFADSVGQEVCLNYADMPAIQHEDKLSQLAYAVQKFGQSGEPFMMLLPNESASSPEVQLGQGEHYAQACLLRLAKTP